MDWTTVKDIFIGLGGLAGIAALVVAGSQALKWRAEAIRLKRELDRTENKTEAETDKAVAEANKTAAESWVLLVQSLSGRVSALEVDQAAKDQRIEELEAEVAELRDYMEKNGLRPPPRKRSRGGES